VKITISPTQEGDKSGRFDDELAITMVREELEDEALAMLRKARAGLIYLALAVNKEEELKPETEEPTMPLQFGPLRTGPQ